MKLVALRELLSEFLGSTFLVMAAISPIILFTSVFESSISIAVIANAITVVCVLCVLIEIFGPISGAHFNPVVTFIMLLEKKILSGKALLFILAQVTGGICGTILTHLMFFEEMGGLLFVSDTSRANYIYFAEIIGTFILVLAVLILVKRGSGKTSVIIALLVGGQLMATSSTMFANPQVTIARMLTNSAAGIRPFDGLFFIIMQFTGALLAYAVYRLMFIKKERSA